MRVEVLYVVRGEDGIHRAGSYSRHVGHGAIDIRLNGRIDVKPDFRPRLGIEPPSGLVLALGAAADVEEGLETQRTSKPKEVKKPRLPESWSRGYHLLDTYPMR